MARILGVGVATCDVIAVLDGYPQEDAKVRILRRRVARGGNAANSLVVLNQLGHGCAWAGVLGDDDASGWIAAELDRCGVDTRYSITAAGGSAPTSYIWVSLASGTRTIAHYRDIPELSAADFGRIPAAFDWVHFEGRHAAETSRMLQSLRAAPAPPRCSVELERPRPGAEELAAYADVVVFSRDYARAGGWTRPEAFLLEMRARLPRAELVCTWGADGAYALAAAGAVVHAPARPPAGGVVDPVGAGDTFNAGLIDALAAGAGLGEAVRRGCALAGVKCGREGLDLPRAELRRPAAT